MQCLCIVYPSHIKYIVCKYYIYNNTMHTSYVQLYIYCINKYIYIYIYMLCDTYIYIYTKHTLCVFYMVTVDKVYM